MGRSDAVPPKVRRGVLEALASRTGVASSSPRIARMRPVGGGCVNSSVRVDTEGDEAFFLKWNSRHPELFPAEARGLEALSRRGPLRIPRVVGVSDERREESVGWLLLEWIEAGEEGATYARRLGRGLADLHRPTSGGWGWSSDNFIGPLPQSNRVRPRWAEFWREERLRPQLLRARRTGRIPGNEEVWEELFATTDDLVAPAEEEGPSLLHGDLWSGNVFADHHGRPVLIDPAVYRGHREVDLAMTELFGGFPPAFYEAYEEARPLRDGYRERRRALYQLYPLLVHVNLFGGAYVARTTQTLERVIEAA